MLRARRVRRRDRVRARRAGRRRVAPQHLSRAPPATSPRTCTSSPSRRTRAGRAATRRRPRSRPTWRTSPAATACWSGSAPAPRCSEARWDGERSRWVLQTSAGRARGRRPDHRLRPALGADGPGDPGPRELRRARPSTRRDGATTSISRAARVAVVGTGCSAIQVVPAIQPVVEHVDVYQRSPGWTIPKMDFAYSERIQRLFERFPALQRLDRAAVVRASWSSARPRMTEQPLAAAAVPRGRPPADQQGDQRPRAAPQGDAARRDRLQADHAHRRVVSDADAPQRRARHRRDRRGDARTASARRTAASARPTCSCSRPASQTHGFVAPMEIVGTGGRTLAEEWADGAARLSRR